MSAGQIINCLACGGTVVYDIKASGAKCIFCGSVSLEVVEPDEAIPVPEAALPMAVDFERANAEYKKWASASWWYPKELRTLSIELRPMFLPAWRFYSHLETHWAGLQRAGTRSGKAPTSGQSSLDLNIMVPASLGLDQSELFGLQPFDEAQSRPWTEHDAEHPWEPPQVTEVGARSRGHRMMADHHRGVIQSQAGLISCKVSPLIQDHDVRLYMLPIYIGAFRYRDKPWRFVINAQTGKVVGKAPTDRMKVAMVVGIALAVILLIGLLLRMG